MKITNKKAIKESKFYKFTKCEGTLVNTRHDENHNPIQELNNYRVNKAPRIESSTKLGNDNSLKIKTYRKGRYQPQMLTVLLVMRMTKRQREKLDKPLNRYYAFEPK